MLNEYRANVDLEDVKFWYNGYYWLKNRLYNPFTMLQFIRNKYLFLNYWNASGTPTFLIKTLLHMNYFLPQLPNAVVTHNVLDTSEIEGLNIEGLLFQCGYLTIEEKIIEKGELPRYRLRIPNYEVQLSLFDHISKYISGHSSNEQNTISQGLKEVIKTANLDKLESVLSTMYSKIPYNNLTHIAKYEGYYVSVLYAYLLAIGMEIIGEEVTNKGRIDLTIKHLNKIYIMEFKLGEDDPLQQIKERKYYEKYMNAGKEIYIIGINFNSEQRNVSKVVWEKLSN
mgnify:CR=1 FL=1